MPPWFHQRLAPFALVGLIVLAHASGWRGALVFDDQSSIIENPAIRRLWPLGPVLAPPADAGVNGRPLASLSFALNYAVHGLDVRGYHAVNIALLAAGALTLLGLVRRTLRLPASPPALSGSADGLALVAAALWALHPAQTGTITYVSQRVEAMMGFCYLLVLYALVRHATDGGRRWAALAVVACAAGMASKEVMVTAPVAALLFDRIFLAGSWRAVLHRWRLHAALAATWGLLFLLIWQSQPAERGVGLALGVSPVDYALAQGRAVWTYLRLAVWPHPLIFDYGWVFFPDRTSALPYVLAVGTGVAGTALALRRWPRAAFPALMFFLVLAPTSSVIPIIQQPIAENRLHLPLAGLMILLTLGLHRLGRHAFWIGGALALAGGLLTAHRNLDYSDPRTLWADTVAKVPTNARAHNNLGSALLAAGRGDEAIGHFATAARLQAGYAEPRQNLGLALLRSGRIAEALPPLQEAAALRPDSVEIRRGLGAVLLALGRHAEAEEALAAAVALRPRDAPALNDLSVARFAAGRFAEAEQDARRALLARPGFAEAHHNLANALVRLGRLDEAEDHFRKALALEPALVKAHHNLGVVLLLRQRPAEAARQFEEVLRLEPAHPEAARRLREAREHRR